MEFGLFYSEIAYISEQNEDLSYPLYPIVNYCFGVVYINIFDYLDGLHSLKNDYAQINWGYLFCLA